MKAVVTGAASGIGSAIAHRLAAEGAAVELLLVDIDAPALSDAADSVSTLGAHVATLTYDLADPGAGAAVAGLALRELGGLEALISNAGLAQPGATLDTLTADEFDRALAVNARATWLLANGVRPLLQASKGCVVATASIAAEFPMPKVGAYSISKAGLVMVIKQLAYEWGPDGIRCNCVSPGPVSTPMSRDDAVARSARAATIPLRRVATPDDIAGAVAFLVSEDASYVTGVNLLVDGGLSTVLARPAG